MKIWESVDTDDYQELRVAVVMNGGVSLAIWIGGVARELNRLTEARPDDDTCYGRLLSLVKSRARIDVLAGTSAGGINAGFLALAAVYGADLKSVGRLWADAGSLMELMRGPLDGQTPSLLKGDSYFLPKLQQAFAQLIGDNAGVRDVADTPIDLTITTSLMDGAVRNFIDDFGTRIQQAEHRGRFRFVRGPQARYDPFTWPDIVDHLALAARSTASFPLAFEASYVPVNPASPPSDRQSFQRSLINFDHSRFVLDGGVLMNMPMEPALRSIFQQPAGNEVRRVLTYINPDPAALSQAEAASFGNPPPVTQVLAAALINLPSAQTISRELRDLKDNNAQARIRKSLRPDLLSAIGLNPDGLAEALFPIYRRIRILHASKNIATEVMTGRRMPQDASDSKNDHAIRQGSRVPAWTTEEISSVFTPDEPRSDETADVDSAPELSLPFVPDDLGFAAGQRWMWGLAPVERLAVVALDILKRALYVAPFLDPDPGPDGSLAPSSALRRSLREGRELIHGCLMEIRAMRWEDSSFWREQAKKLPDPPSADSAERRAALRTWAAASVEQLAAYLEHTGDEHLYTYGHLEATVHQIVDVLLDRKPQLEQAAGHGKQFDDPLVSKEAGQLAEMVNGLLGAGPAPRWERVVSQLLSVEVGYMAMTAGGQMQDQDVELMQISADLRHGFGGPASAGQKLAGVQLAHFGAFYKKSWRVNDWIWGRMDGARRLVEATLTPRRLTQLALHIDAKKPHHTEIMALLHEVAVGEEDPTGYLQREFDKDKPRIERELRFLDDLTLPVPASLPFTSGVIARRLYVEIIQEELGELASAVEFDMNKGADKSGNGAAFARTFNRESAGASDLPPERKLELFANAGIGQERILEEKGTDLFAATASRTAAVMTSLANAPKLPAVRTIFRPVRGLTLLLYSMVYGSVVGSKFGSWLVNAVLATGGALLAVALLADDVPEFVKVIASAILIAGLALAALRSGMLALAFVLGVPIAGLAVYALYRNDAGAYWNLLVERQTTLLTIAGLVIALGALGYVRSMQWPRRLARYMARFRHRH